MTTSLKTLFQTALSFLRSVGINIRPADKLVSKDRKARTTDAIKIAVLKHASGVGSLHDRHRRTSRAALDAKAAKVRAGVGNHRWIHPATPSITEEELAVHVSNAA